MLGKKLIFCSCQFDCGTRLELCESGSISYLLFKFADHICIGDSVSHLVQVPLHEVASVSHGAMTLDARDGSNTVQKRNFSEPGKLSLAQCS